MPLTDDCKETPHTVFAFEKGFALGRNVALTGARPQCAQRSLLRDVTQRAGHALRPAARLRRRFAVRPMKRLQVENAAPERAAMLRLCRGSSGSSECSGRDWYGTCLERIADLEDHAMRHGNLSSALAPWCELCDAAGEALNSEHIWAADDDVDHENAMPVARWLMRRLSRRRSSVG